MAWAQGPSHQGPALKFQKQLIPSTRDEASRMRKEPVRGIENQGLHSSRVG